MASRPPCRSPARARPTALAVALAAALAGPAWAATATGGATGGAMATLDAQPLAQVSAVRAPQVMYLDVSLDGRVVATLVRFTVVDGELSVLPSVLTDAGLQLPNDVPLNAAGEVALADIPGLGVDYQPTMQRVTLLPGSELRPTRLLGYRIPAPVQVDRDHGLVLDWDAYGRRLQGQDTLSLGTGARWFGRWGTLELNGVSRTGDAGSDGYARLDTRWTYSDPKRMWTWSAGDVVSGGLAWSRPVRLGGVQLRRDFGVRPDLIVHPLPQFSADATLPSSVELYVNNIRQYGEEVAPGPFVLSDFPRVSGAGQAVVVVTDALGRTTQTSVPLYVDYQRLARGLTDFSFEAGVLRRGFGIDSDDYGSDVVASGSWRRGMRDDLTLELHGEAGPDLQLAGAGLAWSPLARFGVATGSVSRSEGDGAGTQWSGGYQWFGQRAGFDVNVQRADAGYRDLGTLDGGSVPLRAQDRASAWMAVPRGSLSVTWLRYRDGEDLAGRTVSLGLSQTWGRSVSVFANAFHDDRAGTGVSLTLSLPLGDGLDGALTANHRRSDTELTADVRRRAPYEGGWGWQAQASDDGDGQLAAQYRGDGGEFWAGVDRFDGEHGLFAQGMGSVVLMDGQAFASRRIADAFAVVSTNGIGDVPILYENRTAGRTNDRGYLLLSDLRGWERNRIAIDPDGLSAELRVPAIEQLVTPPNASGLHVAFPLERVRSATVTLLDADGQPVAPGTRVQRADGTEAIVGFEGQLWLEHYRDGEALSWRTQGHDCLAPAPALEAASSASMHCPTGPDACPAVAAVPGSPPSMRCPTGRTL